MNYAFNSIFRQSSGIIIGSVTAFLISQFLDASIFHYLRHITGSRKIWLRATGSTLIGALPPAQFWLDVNNKDAAGHPFNINYAFNSIFRQSSGIIIGSVTAFLISQFLDASIFHYLRHITGSRKIWLRATGSTLISQLVDSIVVLFVAFYLFGNWELKQVLAVAVINYIYKFVVAVVLTPLLYLAHFGIDRYLGNHLSEEIQHEAVLDKSEL